MNKNWLNNKSDWIWYKRICNELISSIAYIHINKRNNLLDETIVICAVANHRTLVTGKNRRFSEARPSYGKTTVSLYSGKIPQLRTTSRGKIAGKSVETRRRLCELAAESETWFDSPPINNREKFYFVPSPFIFPIMARFTSLRRQFKCKFAAEEAPEQMWPKDFPAFEIGSN